MPIYEYQCTECQQVTEAMVKMGGRGPRKCESCSGKLQKIISRTSFQLKGGGWYNEGYTGNGKNPGKSSAKSSSPSSSSKSSTESSSSSSTSGDSSGTKTKSKGSSGS